MEPHTDFEATFGFFFNSHVPICARPQTAVTATRRSKTEKACLGQKTQTNKMAHVRRGIHPKPAQMHLHLPQVQQGWDGRPVPAAQLHCNQTQLRVAGRRTTCHVAPARPSAPGLPAVNYLKKNTCIHTLFDIKNEERLKKKTQTNNPIFYNYYESFFLPHSST